MIIAELAGWSRSTCSPTSSRMLTLVGFVKRYLLAPIKRSIEKRHPDADDRPSSDQE